MINWNKIFITFVFFRWWGWVNETQILEFPIFAQYILALIFFWITSTEHLIASRQISNKKCLRIHAGALSTGEEVLSTELVLRLNFFSSPWLLIFSGKAGTLREAQSNAENVWTLTLFDGERIPICHIFNKLRAEVLYRF